MARDLFSYKAIAYGAFSKNNFIAAEKLGRPSGNHCPLPKNFPAPYRQIIYR